jgi:hypothetical protein
VDRGRTDRFSAGTAHLISNVAMKSVLGSFPGNRLIAGVRSCPDSVAIFEAARRGSDLQNERG